MADDAEVRQLKEIRQELKAIKGNTASAGWFVRGILYGAGWILGSLITLVLIGWGLAALGVVPGLTRIVQDVNNAMSEFRR